MKVYQFHRSGAFVHNRFNDSGNINGLSIYLSLLAPVAALGRYSSYITGKLQSACVFEPDSVLTYEDLESRFEQSVWQAIQKGGFKILHPSEATALLPSDVLPHEYCLGRQPWDRVFHVLFSDTD